MPACVSGGEEQVDDVRIKIGKRDMSDPKYDGYFESARKAIAEAEGKEQKIMPKSY